MSNLIIIQKKQIIMIVTSNLPLIGPQEDKIKPVIKGLNNKNLILFHTDGEIWSDLISISCYD